MSTATLSGEPVARIVELLSLERMPATNGPQIFSQPHPAEAANSKRARVTLVLLHWHCCDDKAQGW